MDVVVEIALVMMIQVRLSNPSVQGLTIMLHREEAVLPLSNMVHQPSTYVGIRPTDVPRWTLPRLRQDIDTRPVGPRVILDRRPGQGEGSSHRNTR